MTVALLVAGVVGFVALSYEILWFRAVSFASAGSPEAFGLLLGFYLGGIAGGSFLAEIVCRNPAAKGHPKYVRFIAWFVCAANVLGYVTLPALAWLATHARWDVGFALMALCAAMFGAALPLASHFSIPPGPLAGTRLSYVYAANIVGSVLGSFLTGFVLLDAWTIQGLSVALLLLGTGVVIALLRSGGVSGSKILGVSLLACGVLIGAAVEAPSLFGQFYEKLLMQDRFTPSYRFADVVENRSGVITVSQDGTVYGSGAYDGQISTSLMVDQNMIIRAYAVAALHRAPRHVLMIGLSTGAWAQVIANNPAVERLTVIEINPGYPDVIERYPQVASLLRNPKVHIVIDDGRRWLTRSRDRFDLIVSNTTFHWRAHTTNLLSREYDWLVRAHLKPGGVYYFNTTGSSAALKTAMTVFPSGLRFMNFAAVGMDSVRFDREELRKALGVWRIDGHLVVDTTVSMQREKLARIVTAADVEDRHSILVRLASTGIVTDDNMLPEWYPERNH